MNRVSRLLRQPMTEIWLCPWGEDANRYEARFHTAVPDDDLSVDTVLQVAGCLCSSWTLELAPEGQGAERIAFQGWTPPGYRRRVMEGLAEASFIVRQQGLADAPATTTPTSGDVRQRVMRNGTVVNVVGRVREQAIE